MSGDDAKRPCCREASRHLAERQPNAAKPRRGRTDSAAEVLKKTIGRGGGAPPAAPRASPLSRGTGAPAQCFLKAHHRHVEPVGSHAQTAVADKLHATATRPAFRSR